MHQEFVQLACLGSQDLWTDDEVGGPLLLAEQLLNDMR